MFGYVRPSLGRLTEEEKVRFQAAYCGLCRTMGRRCGAVSRVFLDDDLSVLAVRVSEGAAGGAGGAFRPGWRRSRCAGGTGEPARGSRTLTRARARSSRH